MSIRVGNEAANSVVTTWTNEWKLNPTEGSVVADFVDKPEVVGKFGQTIKVRFIPAVNGSDMVAVSNAAGGSLLTRANLTQISHSDTVATGTSSLCYGYIAVNRNTWNQVRDSAEYRSGQKKALAAGMVEKVDSDILANAANLSNVITQADIDEAAWVTSYARLRKTAKGKIKYGETDVRLILPPEESGNAMRIASLREYQIRGNQGTAATGSMVSAFGVKWDVSGLVYTVGGVTAYCPVIIKDAWFIAYNETPHPLDDQVDGLSDHFIVVAEYATFEEFDSSGVVLALTIP